MVVGLAFRRGGLLLAFFLVAATHANMFGPPQTPATNEYDYIVIGAGACGGVLATRLAGT